MILYKQIETSAFGHPFKTSTFHQLNQNQADNEEDVINKAKIKLENNAAKVIQKAYRKHLFELHCERRKESWEHVGIPDRLRFINKVSNNVSQINFATNFNFNSWKNQFYEFEKNRQKRAKIFEKQAQSLKILKDEQDFVRGVSKLEDLPEQKPYIHQKAMKDLQWMLERKEKEAILLLL
uniref:Uncharacterized protein n=1 Tax=Panagrolaimus sp. JU765 TaxID=591449 RepID=A0AC34RF20_9BILA